MQKTAERKLKSATRQLNGDCLAKNKNKNKKLLSGKSGTRTRGLSHFRFQLDKVQQKGQNTGFETGARTSRSKNHTSRPISLIWQGSWIITSI
jgi:hypothetical protein